jgi:hypothetical protein
MTLPDRVDAEPEAVEEDELPPPPPPQAAKVPSNALRTDMRKTDDVFMRNLT